MTTAHVTYAACLHLDGVTCDNCAPWRQRATERAVFVPGFFGCSPTPPSKPKRRWPARINGGG